MDVATKPEVGKKRFVFHVRRMGSIRETSNFGTHNTSLVERRRDRGFRDNEERARGAWDRGERTNSPGSRPFPWNGATGWSTEARGMVSGRKGEELIGGWGGQGRDFVQKRAVV